MRISFAEGYRAICWAYVKYDKREQREKFASYIFSYLSSVGINPYLGVCFGKYSRIIDFFHQSAKVATFHLGMIQEKIQKDMAADGVKCAFSTVLCKPFEKEPCKNESIPPINAYTFFRPNSKDLPYERVLSLCKEIRKNELDVIVEAYWNNSMYPLVVITRGKNYQSVVENIDRLRKNSEWAIDSSSYITLKINPSNCKPIEDEVNGNVTAALFFKVQSLSDIDINNVRIRSENVKLLLRCPAEAFGWYDFCDVVLCRNLFDLYEYGQKLKDLSSGKITFTSTALLREGKIV